MSFLLKTKTKSGSYLLSFSPVEINIALSVIKQLSQMQYPANVNINDKGEVSVCFSGDPEIDWKGLGIEIIDLDDLFAMSANGDLLELNQADKQASSPR